MNKEQISNNIKTWFEKEHNKAIGNYIVNQLLKSEDTTPEQKTILGYQKKLISFSKKYKRHWFDQYIKTIINNNPLLLEKWNNRTMTMNQRLGSENGKKYNDWLIGLEGFDNLPQETITMIHNQILSELPKGQFITQDMVREIGIKEEVKDKDITQFLAIIQKDIKDKSIQRSLKEVVYLYNKELKYLNEVTKSLMLFILDEKFRLGQEFGYDLKLI